MYQPQQLTRLGQTIRQVREYRGFKQEYVAYKLGYKDKSMYAKIERGEVKSLDFFLLIRICEVLLCNLVLISMMSEIDVLNTDIIPEEFTCQFRDEKSLKTDCTE